MRNKTRSDRSPHNPYPQNLLTFLSPLPWWMSLPSPKLPRPEMFISFPLSPYISNLATGPGDCMPLASPECVHLPIPPTSASVAWITIAASELVLFPEAILWAIFLKYASEHFTSLNGSIAHYNFQDKAQPPEHDIQNLHDLVFVFFLNLIFHGVLVNV